MKHILITAYDINPYRGSESSTGWNFIWQAAQRNYVSAVTRHNNKPHILRYIKQHNLNDANLEFIYYDLPYVLRFWKRGSRGSLLYFYLWQMSLPLVIWSKRKKYDIVHGLNFHCDWAPSFLWILGRPFVWGPVNHHEPIPWRYIKKSATWVGIFKDRLKFILKLVLWNLDPFLFICKKSADLILCGNSSVMKRLKLRDKNAIIFSQVGVEPPRTLKVKTNLSSFIVMTAGRLIDIKSFDIAIQSFAEFVKSQETTPDNFQLWVIGDGELCNRLKKLTETLGIGSFVTFTGWIDNDLMPDFYSKADVFLFCSHEGAGMVVSEAQAHGLPVICFNNYGPGETVNDKSAIRIDYKDYDKSVLEISKILDRLYKDRKYLTSLSKGAIELSMIQTWSNKGLILNDLYEKI